MRKKCASDVLAALRGSPYNAITIRLFAGYGNERHRDRHEDSLLVRSRVLLHGVNQDGRKLCDSIDQVGIVACARDSFGEQNNNDRNCGIPQNDELASCHNDLKVDRR